MRIISVDSTLVYRGMDIGAAKPGVDVLERYPHELVNIRDPAESYSAAGFQADADTLVRETLAQGKIPLLVGGSMLYFKAFQYGLADLPEAAPEIRSALTQQAQSEGWKSLHRELDRVDPRAARKIHPNNIQRLQRALEVYRATGKPISWWWEQQPVSRPEQRYEADYRQFVLSGVDRVELHRRIETRFMAMLESGFEAEVSSLRARPDLTLDLPSMRAVGYRQIWQHQTGETGRQEMIRQAIAATRQLAKRQSTWLNNWPGLEGISASDPDPAATILKKLQQAPIVEDRTGVD